MKVATARRGHDTSHWLRARHACRAFYQKTQRESAWSVPTPRKELAMSGHLASDLAADFVLEIAEGITSEIASGFAAAAVALFLAVGAETEENGHLHDELSLRPNWRSQGRQ